MLCEVAATPPENSKSHLQDEDNVATGPLRYLPYAARMKILLLQANIKIAAVQGVRYVAYSSDVGESFRPMIKPWMVNATYGIAGAYVLGDVGYSGYKANRAGHSKEVVAATAAHTLVFQCLASLALPAVIIHTVVHQAQHFCHRPAFVSMPRVVRFGPSAIGLALIPAMPLLDPPVEYVIDTVFDKVWPVWRGAHVHEH